MIDVSELMQDPDFASMVQILRPGMPTVANEGVYTPGEDEVINRVMIVQPASAEDRVNYLPEGERQLDAVKIYSDQLLNMADGDQVQSDKIIWLGNNFRIAFAKPWQQHGFYFAIGVGYVP